MNEAFSDIFGEAVDILNMDTTDPDRLRTEYPTTCHETLNNEFGVPPGQDPGTRWSMGENVTTTAENGDGSKGPCCIAAARLVTSCLQSPTKQNTLLCLSVCLHIYS
jgi:hypothetical protein